MTQFNKLSNREWEVLGLLLQGKSNKQKASSLNISVRTVEFHLKNIYAKLQVSSRIELIMKLGNTTGTVETDKLGHSTVDGKREIAENRDGLTSQVSWTTHVKDTVSVIGKELEMKNLLRSKHVRVGVLTAIFTGILWVSALMYSQSIPLDIIKRWVAPLIVILPTIGLSVGLTGKRNGSTLRRVFFSALLGTGLSPFLIMPLMLTVVVPLGKLAEWVGLIDPSTMPGEVATILATTIMIAIWLIVGLTIGLTSLFVTIKKPEPPIVQRRTSENGS